MIDRLTDSLEHYMDLLSARQKVVASNIANVDTPGYIAKELDFSDFLRNAATESLTPATAQTPQRNLSGPRVVEQQPTTIGLDGNTVDPGREMSTMAEAGMKYLEGTQILQMRLRTLRTAIREGK